MPLPKQVVHIEEQLNGRVIEIDDIYKDGSKRQHKIDSTGQHTETETDRVGRLFHGEFRDSQGMIIEKSQRTNDGTWTYDGNGKVVNIVRELPGGGTTVELVVPGDLEIVLITKNQQG